MPLNPPIAQWRDRRCWIIGASTGIGAALADRLAALGARVALSSRRREWLDEKVARLGEARALALPLDVRDPRALVAAAHAIVGAWGGIDLVVFMAGDYRAMRAWEIDLDAARTTIETNLTGCFNALAAAVPVLMKQRAGTLALVASVAGFRGLPKSLVYGPTKAALINLAETLYLELRPQGVGVCGINPGFVRTPLTAGNDFRMPALIEPDEAAREIAAGLARGDFEIHFPRRFTRWLKVMRVLPYRLYFPAIRRMTGP